MGIFKIPKIVKSPTFLRVRSRLYSSYENLAYVGSEDKEKGASFGSSNGRVMLIDGTSVIYRAYFKLLAKLHRGFLTHADANGDWVLTIFSALSLIINVLKLTPSHVAVGTTSYFSCIQLFQTSLRVGCGEKNVVFDHDGFPLGQANYLLRHGTVAKGKNFRHDIYPLYKNNRPPTPDTIVQGLQYLKAAISAMSIKVIEVPGVEADDVIGTLAVRSVAAGFKDTPYTMSLILSIPSNKVIIVEKLKSENCFLYLGMVSFGMEEFTKKYGTIRPEQFVDVMSLAGDSSDNIPGSFTLEESVGGIGECHAVRLITEYGTLENLLHNIERVKEGKIKKALISSAEQAMLSKRLAQLCCDLPRDMVPYTTEDLIFTKPEDDGEKFRNLLRAIGAYAQGCSADYIIRDVVDMWKKLERC
ncbi:hypothetical protein LIER_19126 [Lithospermum erythrorhizon]|uniref:5'-3' exonuclease domain-containing protein n=1 Tax=Lithospermum erythrorhizon TaxID=34254 RepID=A0AAV3QGI9_LITER